MARVTEVGKKQTGSDCFIRLEIKKSGGLDIGIKSKVESMYGKSIRALATEMLGFFGIKHARMSIEDGGSVPFILRARIEAAVKKCLPDTKGEFVVPIAKENRYEIERDSFRRSRLYVPGDQARLIINAGLYRPDGIILDLEDAVAPPQKEGARFIVRNALREMDFFGAERMVRINQLPIGLEDLEFIVGHGVHTILIPKVETGDQVKQVDKKVQKLRKERKVKQEIYLMPIIESALGAINAYQIATASPNNVALTIGLEDYSADICTQRTKKGDESFFARVAVVTAARAAKIQPIDSVFSDVADMEGLKESVLEAKGLGFEGKGCIHPNQIQVLHENFAPSEKEIEKAKKISLALEEAQKKGLGVVSLGTKMIDPPVVKRAQTVLDLAIRAGLIPIDWKRQDKR